MNLIQQADALATRVKQIVAFAEKYNHKIHKDIQGGLQMDQEKATYLVFVQHFGEGNREKVLALYGDTFGRDGWTAKPDTYCAKFDWYKVVDGITIQLYGAEKMPKMEEYTIPATKFPLQLTDEEISDAVPTDLAAV